MRVRHRPAAGTVAGRPPSPVRRSVPRLAPGNGFSTVPQLDRFLALALAGPPAIALSGPAARGQATPAPVSAATGRRIAVVNRNALLGARSPRWPTVRAHIQNQQNLIDIGRKAHATQVDELKNQIHNLKPDSEQFDAKLVEIDEQSAKFETEDKLRQAVLLREINLKKKKLYENIMAVTADLAKRKGIDVVMIYNDVQIPIGVSEMSPDQLNGVLAQRQMLYVSPKVDLSDEVATALDAQVKAAMANPSPAPVTPR